MTYQNAFRAWLVPTLGITTCVPLIKTRVLPNNMMYKHGNMDMAPLVRLNVMISMRGVFACRMQNVAH